MTVTYNKASGN